MSLSPLSSSLSFCSFYDFNLNWSDFGARLRGCLCSHCSRKQPTIDLLAHKPTLHRGKSLSLSQFCCWLFQNVLFPMRHALHLIVSQSVPFIGRQLPVFSHTHKSVHRCPVFHVHVKANNLCVVARCALGTRAWTLSCQGNLRSSR